MVEMVSDDIVLFRLYECINFIQRNLCLDSVYTINNNYF